MPNVKDPEIRLLEQLIKAGELDIALSYTQVLDRVPLVKARFATDPGYEKNFKNYWSSIRTKYRTQALLGRPTGDDYGEPTPPDPLDLPPARTPPSSAPSTPGRSSSPPSVSSPPSLSSSFSSMVGTTPPRHTLVVPPPSMMPIPQWLASHFELQWNRKTSEEVPTGGGKGEF